ncbi:MAG: hypothetical protein KGI51_15175, partial [Rhodospirillales bacterium]|nr:hypothetical protein [Rhodospirillales bacterium]
LQQAHRISASVTSCAQMEHEAIVDHSPRPADPGPIDLTHVQPPSFRQMLSTLPIGKASQPLVAPDGIAVMIVCNREQRNAAELTPEEVRLQLLAGRVDLLSRQLQQDLRSQARIEHLGAP